MPQVLTVADDPTTGWPTTAAEVHALRGVRRWPALAAAADVAHLDGPASVRLGPLLRRLPRPAGRAQLRVVASGADRPGGGLGGWLTRRGLHAADRVVARTPGQAQRYAALGVDPARLVSVPYPAPPPSTPPAPAAFRQLLDIPESARLVVAAGRFDRTADARTAVWAFDAVKYAAPDLYLVLVGDGPGRERTAGFAHALGFDDYRVRFAGKRWSFADAVPLAEVVWVTPDRGGVPDLLAGLAAGKPVVAVGNADLSELVQDGTTARLVPPGDRIRLAAVTLELLGDPASATALGEAARRHAAAAHPAAEVSARLVAVYDDLMSSPAARE